MAIDPVADTVVRFTRLHAADVGAWCWFALLPVVLPAVVALVQRRRLRGKRSYVLPTAARILGYPALLVLLVGVPCVAFTVYLAPVVLDAHPGSRPLLGAILAPLDWVSANWLVLSFVLTLLWPLWVIGVALHCARRLRRESPLA